jgi:hypothetical protein
METNERCRLSSVVVGGIAAGALFLLTGCSIVAGTTEGTHALFTGIAGVAKTAKEGADSENKYLTYQQTRHLGTADKLKAIMQKWLRDEGISKEAQQEAQGS